MIVDCFRPVDALISPVSLEKFANNQSFLVCNGTRRVHQYRVFNKNHIVYFRYFEFGSNAVDALFVEEKSGSGSTCLRLLVLCHKIESSINQVYFEFDD